MSTESRALIEEASARVFTIPTDRPESDGTLEWSKTTILIVHVRAAGKSGLGYSYTHPAAGGIVTSLLFPLLKDKDAMDVPACWAAMVSAIRNLGQTGLCMMAVSAVDSALWDLKAKLLGLPLARLLGQYRSFVELYGSGGFTSYTESELRYQFAGWAAEGFTKMKMKVGRDPENDPRRVASAREAIGEKPSLFVDANGAYSVKLALQMAELFARSGVVWFEEPVYHHDMSEMRFVRERVPSGMSIASGEYGFNIGYFRNLIQSGAADIIQADATRCGMSGFMTAGQLCGAYGIPFSSHCAPSLHLHAACSLQTFKCMEYFHDHVRIENMLFDGVIQPSNGTLRPDLSRPGMGLSLKEADARRFENKT